MRLLVQATGLLQLLLGKRIVRFALVGAVGIPVNVGFLWLFHRVFSMQTIAAWLLAFECSALINFYANQRITYSEQIHVRGIEWLRRAIRSQVTTISGVAVNAAVFAGLLAAGVHYLPADTAGIVAAFVGNFVISNRFVFKPAPLEHVPGAVGPHGDSALGSAFHSVLGGQSSSMGLALEGASASLSSGAMPHGEHLDRSTMLDQRLS